MSHSALTDMPRHFHRGHIVGLPSVCSAHPLVIEAALLLGHSRNRVVLVEATCNQVNQDGGYTGLTPTAFRDFVFSIAAKVGFPLHRLILGGDHLGPNAWKQLTVDHAMDKAEAMVAAYVTAGFSKLHLDCSMACADDTAPLTDQVIADRAARLARVAERTAAHNNIAAPVYIIGTEVPVPGGATEAIDHLKITTQQSALETVAIHRAAFAHLGIDAAFDRVIGLVVQPGVEFGNENVLPYEPSNAKSLSKTLQLLPGMIFEAHSTDYQTPTALRSLVLDGFAILKVGPGLSFALREALYALDKISTDLHGLAAYLPDVMEALMLSDPQHWHSHYHGTTDQLRQQRHLSQSDRIRYYWAQPEAVAAVENLFRQFGEAIVPKAVVQHYLPDFDFSALGTQNGWTAKSVVLGAVATVLARYDAACFAVVQNR